MSWFFKSFTEEMELLRDQVGRFDNSRAKSLDLSKSYKEKKNYLDKSRNELNKGNLSVKLSELIESDCLSKLELIKNSLKEECGTQSVLIDKLNKSISKSKENAFVLLFEDFIPEDSFNEKLIVLAKAHKNGELKKDVRKDLNLYRVENLSKGRVYVKDSKRTQFADLILRNEQGQILFLVRNKNDEFEPGKYCLPGGHIEPNETALAGAIRECEEETGIKVPISDVISVGDYIDNDIHIHYFLAEVSSDTQPIVLEEREQSQYEWVDLDQIENKDLLMNLKENLTNLIDIPRSNTENDLFKSISILQFPYPQDLRTFKRGNDINFYVYSDECIDVLEKGGKRAMIGEIREFMVGGKPRKMRKTATGWKYVGKGEISKKEVEEKPSKAEESPFEEKSIMKRLGGSSEVTLRKYKGGLYVFKKERDRPTGKSQLVSEVSADSIYKALGYEAPYSNLLKDDKTGLLYKTSEYINYPGIKELGAIPASERKEFYHEISKGFALDALLGNWDVIGRGLDNILCYRDKDNKPHIVRIDNGGSLNYRARGAEKPDFLTNFAVSEIESMRTTDPGNVVFADLTTEEIQAQFKEIIEKKGLIMDLLPNSAIQNAIEKRLEWVEKNYLTKEPSKEESESKETLRIDMPSLVTQRYFDKGWDELELKGNPELKSHIKSHIIEIERKFEDTYKSEAIDMGISVEAYKAVLQDLVEKMIEKSKGYIAIRHDTVLPLIFAPDGRFKSQFETSTSGGAMSPVNRSQTEYGFFGFKNDPKFEAEKRPIYGYMTNQQTGWTGEGRHRPNVGGYGDTFCKIKDEKFKSSATFTVGDSLDEYRRQAATPVGKPHFTSFGPAPSKTEIDRIKKYISGEISSLHGYIEVQYHDQLQLSDIETVKCSLDLLGLDKINKISKHLFEFTRKLPVEKSKDIDFNFEITKQ